MIAPPSKHAGYVVLDSDVESHIEKRTNMLRAFLDAVRSGRRSEWLFDFYGPNAPQTRFAEKDESEIIEDILSKTDSCTRFLYHCPRCGRIHVETSPRSGEFQAYAAD